MVKQLITLFLLFPIFLYSGEFTSSVSRNEVPVSDTFTLNLFLKGASPKGVPSLDILNQSFTIVSQQQSFNTSMVNGKMSSAITWKVSLMPKQEGEWVIPELSIDTTEGILSTVPIKIVVSKASASAKSNEGVSLKAEASNHSPYKNEPFLYTLTIHSKSDLADVKMQKLEIENALVEMNGEAKISRQVIDGLNTHIVEFDYLVTPIKAGPLKIPSVLLQAYVPVRRSAAYDDEMDLFSMVQGFNRVKPVNLMTSEISLEVLPAIADMDPWLPAKSLSIEEDWDDNQLLQVGEPLTRGFRIVAEGIKSNQLPSLNNQMLTGSEFKVYADKPELKDDNAFKSLRKEQYTLIPQKGGLLTLPEMSILWWDTAKKEKVVARLPARTLNIGISSSALDPQLEIGEAWAMNDRAVSQPEIIEVVKSSLWSLMIIAVLSFLLVASLFVNFILQKRINALRLNLKGRNTGYNCFAPLQNRSQGTKKEKLPDLNPT